MTELSDFQPGDKLPTLGVNDRNISTWTRWALPIGTGLAVALIAMFLI
jgi:hypothetical protein